MTDYLTISGERIAKEDVATIFEKMRDSGPEVTALLRTGETVRLRLRERNEGNDKNRGEQGGSLD